TTDQPAGLSRRRHGAGGRYGHPALAAHQREHVIVHDAVDARGLSELAGAAAARLGGARRGRDAGGDQHGRGPGHRSGRLPLAPADRDAAQRARRRLGGRSVPADAVGGSLRGPMARAGALAPRLASALERDYSRPRTGKIETPTPSRIVFASIICDPPGWNWCRKPALKLTDALFPTITRAPPSRIGASTLVWSYPVPVRNPTDARRYGA